MLLVYQILELSVYAHIHAYTLTRSLTHSSLSLSLTHTHVYIHSHTLFQTHLDTDLHWRKIFYSRRNHKFNLITTAKHTAINSAHVGLCCSPSIVIHLTAWIGEILISLICVVCKSPFVGSQREQPTFWHNTWNNWKDCGLKELINGTISIKHYVKCNKGAQHH